MAMKCNEFLGDILSPCKLCKKVLCGFEKCLVSKVVFYIMLDVAWNSLVLWWSWVWARKNWRVVSLFSNDGCVLGTQTLTNSIRSRLLCLPSSSFPTVHQLAKNRNRTSRAWRGPHPLHIIVFSVGRNDDKISKLRCKRQTNMRPYPWSNIPMAKLCSIHKSFLIYWSLFIWPLPGLKYQFLWWHKNTYKCFNWNFRLLFWCKISLVSQVTTASCLLYLWLYFPFFAMSSRLRGKGTLEWLNTNFHFSNCYNLKNYLFFFPFPFFFNRLRGTVQFLLGRGSIPKRSFLLCVSSLLLKGTLWERFPSGIQTDTWVKKKLTTKTSAALFHTTKKSWQNLVLPYSTILTLKSQLTV